MQRRRRGLQQRWGGSRWVRSPIILLSATLLATSSVLNFAVMPQSVKAYGGGDGTSNDPYQISSCADLTSINSALSAHYILTTDLDCTSDANSIIIGGGTGFNGVFDGRYHEIIIDLNTNNTALFGTGLFTQLTSGGVVKNLRVGGGVISNTDFTGMLAGSIIGATVDNVSISGGVTSFANYVGGAFGRSRCNALINGVNSSVIVVGTNYVGGLTGQDSCGGLASTYTNSAASGSVNGTDTVGGLIGGTYQTQLTHTRATGSVAGRDKVGGLVGQSNGTSSSRNIYLSSATGNVSGRYSLGGLVGEATAGEIVQSYANGNISGTNGDDIGGFVGRAVDSAVTISDSYSRGNASTSGSGNVGGFVGYGNSTHLTNVYTTSHVTTGAAFGGISGNGTIASLSNVFWDTQTVGAATACDNGDCGGGASGKTTALMKTRSTFTNASWDFSSKWTMNGGYPFLLAQSQFLCQAPTTTATTGTTGCELSYPGETVDPAAVTWQARFRKASDVGWTDVTIDNPTIGVMTFHGLDPATDYQLGVKPTNSLFDNWAVTEVQTLSANSDVDNDGQLDVEEDAGQNRGDINDDGILDARQAHVSSFVSPVSNRYMSLMTTCNDNFNVQIGAESAESKDAGYDYTAGLVGFVGRGCGAPGATVTVTQYYFGNYNLSNLSLRKSSSSSYRSLSGAVLTKVTIGGQSAVKVVYQIVDGGPLDEDGIADGNIVDPVGLATAVVGVPNTGLGN